MDWSNVSQVENLANGLLVVIIGILTWLGINRGRSPRRSDVAEVAGAIVDNSSIDRLTAAVEAQTTELVAHRVADRDHQTGAKDNAKGIERALIGLTKEVEELRDEVRRHGDVLGRRPP